MTRSRGILVGLILLTLTAVIVGVTYKFINFWMSPASKEQQKYVYFEVKKGTAALEIATELAKSGAVSNSRLFYWYGRITGKSAKVKAGDYRLSSSMKPDEVFNVLMSGISYGLPLTIPEGFNMRQIAEAFDALRPGDGEQFYSLCRNKKFIRSLELDPPSGTLEGYLYPDTYSVTRRASPEEVIRQMVKKTMAIFTPEAHSRLHELGFTVHQILTLASVIEKETGAAKERPIISSVFHNRIRKKMKLQSDPTVVYGRDDFDGNIRKSDLLMRTPYNTYVIYGLPLGPISNPGRDAIMAAMYPQPSEYIYFVSHNDGTHEFTVDYKDHLKAVAKYQLDRKAREGKSWRDLNKK